MNEVLEKMKSRRSIRSYQPDAVPQELLDQIIEAGLYAASGKGTQNTIILQVTNQELRDEIAKKNCEVKYKVVMKDERESGLREVLNLGHTFGRAMSTTAALLWAI